MMEIYKITETEWLQLAIEEATWSGKRYQAPRILKFNLFYTSKNGHEITGVYEGDTILFKWKGKELFRGTVWKRDLTLKSVVSITCYDKMQYLLTNKDVYVFNNQRLDQIATRVLNDFDIAKGNIPYTGFTIKSLVFSSVTSGYDIILKAISETYKQTGNMYRVFSRAGKIELATWNDPDDIYLLEEYKNIIDVNLTTSIEEAITKVKVILTKGKKTYYGHAKDDYTNEKYGNIQYTESVSDNLNQAQLNERAKQLLNAKKGLNIDLSATFVGVPDIVSGVPVQANIPRYAIKQKYYVDSDTHTFKGTSHTTNVTLIKENKIPEVGL
ncbi:phage portal protein [Listeria booriae]|nr:phage portal protein [Listeria booriae]